MINYGRTMLNATRQPACRTTEGRTRGAGSSYDQRRQRDTAEV